MHFWIDKRSQGCGRYRVPLSFTGPSRNQRLLFVGVHPKLMVTPVHRFQSIESVVTNTARHPRAHASYHHHHSNNARLPPNCGPSFAYHASTSRNATASNSTEVLDHGHGNQTAPPTRQNSASSSTGKLKCVVWAFFGLSTFFIACAKYYFHPGVMGMEAFVLCTLLGILLFIGGVISLYDIVINPVGNSNSTPQQPLAVQVSNETQDETRQMAQETRPAMQPIGELPPPPYHIAIMLPSHDGRTGSRRITTTTTSTIVSDSPPPSYEKVVT